jgi:hypothetical protein
LSACFVAGLPQIVSGSWAFSASLSALPDAGAPLGAAPVDGASEGATADGVGDGATDGAVLGASTEGWADGRSGAVLAAGVGDAVPPQATTARHRAAVAAAPMRGRRVKGRSP